MEVKKNKRIEWIDISKGIGMTAVILGHCVGLGTAVHNIIFAFHMPLFFILSGIFHKDEPLMTAVKKKFMTLIIPYVLFCLFGGIVTLLIPQWRNIGIRDLISDIYLGVPSAVNVSSIWFLICLFWVSAAFNIIRKIRKPVIEYIIILFLTAAGFVLSILINKGVIPRRLPLDLDAAPVALFFYAAGYYSKSLLMKINEWYVKKEKVLLKILLALSACGIFAVLVKLNGRVNLYGMCYNRWYLYILEGLLGSMIVMIFSRITENTGFIRPVKWIGKNSLLFLGTQAVFVRISIILINKCFGENFELYGLPYKYALISFVFTSAASCVFVYAVLKIKSELKKGSLK